MTDTIIAFAITTNKGWHGYPGEIPLLHMHAFFRELYVALNNPYKIRMHTRKPRSSMIRVAYSSIAFYFKQRPNEINIEESFADKLRHILNKHAALDVDSFYEIRLMDQHKNLAFVAHVKTDKEEQKGVVSTEFHNEWFAMPLYDASSLHLFGKEEGKDPVGKEYSRIFEYDPEHGHIPMYRGNACDRWIAYKLTNVSNHMYYMDLNNVTVDGIYDGTKCQVLLNVATEPQNKMVSEPTQKHDALLVKHRKFVFDLIDMTDAYNWPERESIKKNLLEAIEEDCLDQDKFIDFLTSTVPRRTKMIQFKKGSSLKDLERG